MVDWLACLADATDRRDRAVADRRAAVVGARRAGLGLAEICRAGRTSPSAVYLMVRRFEEAEADAEVGDVS